MNFTLKLVQIRMGTTRVLDIYFGIGGVERTFSLVRWNVPSNFKVSSLAERGYI